MTTTDLEPWPATRPSPWRGRTNLPPAAGAASVSIQLLDGFQLWVGDWQVPDLPPGKARSLLIYLLLHRHRALTRTRLCALFWPDATPEAARNSLNVQLHRVRRQLGTTQLLQRSEAGYQICWRGAVWCDVDAFEQHASLGARADAADRADEAIAHFEAAAALYRTDLVEDGDVDPVLLPRAQALRDQLNQVLERLSCRLESRQDLHGALRTALRHLALDDCNEGAHRRLMRCYARLGQPQLAERQYRQCRATLQRLLALSPDAETTELYRRITRRDAL